MAREQKRRAPRDYDLAIDKIRYMVGLWTKAASTLPRGFDRSRFLARAAAYTEVADFLSDGVGKEERAAKKGARKP